MKGGKAPRIQGDRVEREIVKLHKKIGLAAGYQGNGEDVDIYPPDWIAPLYCQVKSLGSDRGTKMLLEWLGDADALFLCYKADPDGPARPPVVVLPWKIWERLVSP